MADNSMASVLETLRADVRSQDQAELSLGDTLDVKASILLVIVVFLEGITVDLISAKWPLRTAALDFQLACGALLAVSGILILRVIWPTDYSVEDENRAQELLSYFEDNPGAAVDLLVTEVILKSDITITLERVTNNHAVNARKSNILYWAFYVATFVSGLEIMSALLALRPLL